MKWYNNIYVACIILFTDANCPEDNKKGGLIDLN